MKNNYTNSKFEELAHMSVPLAFTKLHYEQESASSTPWSKESFLFKPYIVYKFDGADTYFYYDVEGIKWQIDQAGKYEKRADAINLAKTKFDVIKETLLEERALDKKELKTFLNNVRELFPWMNYMWWAIEYEDKNTKKLSDLMELRKYTEYFTPGMFAVIRNSFKKIYPEFNAFVDFIDLEEFENDKNLSLDKLVERSKGFNYTDGIFFKSFDEIIKKYKIDIKNNVPVDQLILKGQTAYPGKVIGKIKIVQSRKDIAGFEIGDIILSSTTTPDFLPAMRISSAIISEHGGVICHAAITSRELKIPCVVGVKGALSILKDGDMVEVDADKGVVKIIV